MLDGGQTSLTLAVSYALGHRIVCAHCREPYVYLQTGAFAGGGADKTYRADGKKLAREALNTIEAGMRRVVSRDGGKGRCPSCRRYQPQMVRAALKFAVGVSAAAAVAGAALGFLATSVLTVKGAGVAGICVLSACAAAAAAFMIARTLGPGSGPSRAPDPFSKSEERFIKWARDAREEDGDPLLLWAASLRRIVAGALPVSLGVRGDLPEELADLHVDRVFPTVKLSYDDRRGRLKLRDLISAEKPKKPKTKTTKPKASKAKAPLKRKARRR